jgi:hypothetical protein
MAEVTRVHGDTIASGQFGRELQFITITVTGDLTVAGVLDDVRKIIDQYASITFVGTADATGVVFGIEGGSVLDLEELGPGSETFAQVEGEIDAIASLSGTAIAIITAVGDAFV